MSQQLQLGVKGYFCAYCVFDNKGHFSITKAECWKEQQDPMQVFSLLVQPYPSIFPHSDGSACTAAWLARPIKGDVGTEPVKPTMVIQWESVPVKGQADWGIPDFEISRMSLVPRELGDENGLKENDFWEVTRSMNDCESKPSREPKDGGPISSAERDLQKLGKHILN